MTFAFTVVFLMSKYKASLQGSDEILKGFCVAFALYASYAISYGSGAILNPALAIAQTCY